MASSSFADQLESTLQNVHYDSFATENERTKAKDMLLTALRRIQSPWDIASQQAWTEPVTTAVIKTLIDARFWKKWVAVGGQPANVDYLANTSGIESTLLRRLLRQLAGQKFLLEVDEDTFALTPFSKALADDKFPSLYAFLYELNQPGFGNYPKFAAEIGYVNSSPSHKTNFQHWQGTDETFFTLLAKRPELGRHFHDSMTIYSAARTSWTDIYPTDSIVSAAKDGRVLVVDVGGGNGHDLEKFRIKHSDVPNGSLVVQDQVSVVDALQLQLPCIGQAHDFFKPQPIHGARVYYLHKVLHDWPDKEAVKILQNLARSMEKGYSKILMHETAIKPKGAHPNSTVSDVSMMMTFGAAERSEAMWYDLVAQAGLSITKFWTNPDSAESVIEVELP